MKIAIAGGGPAGLFAAWAAMQEDQHEIIVLDRDPVYRPERIFALQYLHELCDLPESEVRDLGLHYFITGLDRKLVMQVGEEKAAKYQYNSKLGRPLSEENSTRFAFSDAPTKTIYSLRDAYGFLHNAIGITQAELTFDEIVENMSKQFDLVVSTVPLDKLLPHWIWPTMDLWITQNYVPEEANIADGMCIINVGQDAGWSRATILDGGSATEWAKPTGRVGLEYDKLRKIIPPPRLPTLPENVFLAGRWGSWDAGVLTHHAYHRMKNILGSLK